MWTKIINYQNFVRYAVHLGAKVEDSKDHRLGFLVLGERKNRFIFRLDRMLLSYFSNKSLINKIAASGASFLFITSRQEYYSVIRSSADKCSQMALLWRPSTLSNLKSRIEALDDLYENQVLDGIISEVYPQTQRFRTFW